MIKVGIKTDFDHLNQYLLEMNRIQNTHKLFFLFILLSTLSCQKDQLIPDTGRKLVINGLIVTDGLLGIHLSNSMFITDSTKWLGEDIINNAQVYIYDEDSYIDSLRFQNNVPFNYFDYQISLNYIASFLQPSSGKEYKITVKAPGFPDAFATTKIPNLVKIEKVETAKVILEGTFQEGESNILLQSNIEFTDPANEKNYYLVYVYVKHDDQGSWNMAFVCTDPIVEEYLDHGTISFGVAFSDKNINGKKYKLPITLNGNYIGWPFRKEYPPDYPFPVEYKTAIYFRLYSITEEYFKYIQTLNLFLKNYTNPLAEPTQMYSNITGGYGIFAGAAVSSDSIIYQK